MVLLEKLDEINALMAALITIDKTDLFFSKKSVSADFYCHFPLKIDAIFNQKHYIVSIFGPPNLG